MAEQPVNTLAKVGGNIINEKPFADLLQAILGSLVGRVQVSSFNIIQSHQSVTFLRDQFSAGNPR